MAGGSEEAHKHDNEDAAGRPAPRLAEATLALDPDDKLELFRRFRLSFDANGSVTRCVL